MAKASESEIKSLGAEIFQRMKGQKPSVFQKDWWSGKMMDFSMKDDAFKVEMFRFVDVFPTLKDPVQIAEHLQEYFCRPEQDFPATFQWGLGRVKPDGRLAKIAAGQIEKQVVGMASKFIAGSDAEEALPTLKQMWGQGLSFTLDLLGESTVSEQEAQAYYDRYEEILDALVHHTKSFPQQDLLERSPYGSVPRVNISVKVTSLYSQIDPIDFQGSIDSIKARLRPLMRKARAAGAFINVDMESYAYKDLTYATFKSLMDEPEFVDYPHAGVVVQAYLRDAEADVNELCKWAKKRGTPVTIRLVKGAYWDYETIKAEQNGWPIPVFSKKWETDASFERCAEILIDHHKYIRTAIGSHNVRSMAHAMTYARARKLEKGALEFQMLYGMAEPMKLALKDMGYRVRDYVPIGEMIPGMAYLVRRLLENTSNESWLRASFADGQSMDVLMAKPDGQKSDGSAPDGAFTAHGFRNESLRDFAHAPHREAFARAMTQVRGQLGQTYCPVIAGEKIEAGEVLESIDPSKTDRVVGKIVLATKAHAEAAIDSAHGFKHAWAKHPAKSRAQLLMKVATLMQARRDELSAWMVFEVGKTWREADADVCEAIDFCDYYAREMMRLDKPQRLGHVPGELGLLSYRPRGVAAVIAPWNFPLAIMCGMAMAAVVTGNPVIIKPAEQSSVIGAKFFEIVQQAGFPAEAVHFLPGLGEDVGRALVASPRVQIVAFTGSKEVGLEILKAAGTTLPGQRWVKHVVCEMGGKNAIVVDADADLDEAVEGVVHSAFAFQGQKCSACSRVIVHEKCYDEFKHRLVEATRSLVIGPAPDPASGLGPVIDEDARSKILSYVEAGKREGALLLGMDAPQGGYYVGPHIFEISDPQSSIAQEEIFGPVLALMKVDSFEQGIEIANDVPYALTGGVFSRSPNNIQMAYDMFDVGNLYINRGCTGALVFRQPFGGYQMSGTGTKAGGPDYLQQFMVPRVVSENTMRRGFAPED